MNSNTMLPPVILKMIQFQPGDKVTSHYGPGEVCGVRLHPKMYQIRLKWGAVAFLQAGCIMPQLQQLSRNEIPTGTSVATPDGDAKVVQYNADTSTYTVKMALDQSIRTFAKSDCRLGSDVSVSSPFGNGHVVEYCLVSDTYQVAIRHLGVAFIQAGEISPADMRLLALLPKPMTANDIYDKFKGSVSQEQARAAAVAAENAYETLRVFCEQNSSFVQQGRKNMTQAISLADPAFQRAAKQVELTGRAELEKMVGLAHDMKRRLGSAVDESTLAHETSELLKRSKVILGEIGSSEEAQALKSHFKSQIGKTLESNEAKNILERALKFIESRTQVQQARIDAFSRDKLIKAIEDKRRSSQGKQLAMSSKIISDQVDKFAAEQFGVALTALDPVDVLERIHDFLPNATEKATKVIQEYEKYFTKLQDTGKGAALLAKAKHYVDAAESGDLTGKITTAMAEVDLKKWEKWGGNMAKDPEARQKFADKIKDKSLDFLMSVLPSISVPPIKGTKDEVEYAISNLDLSNFTLKKEKVYVKLAGLGDQEVLRIRATNIGALIPDFKWSFVQNTFPYLNGGGSADAQVIGGSISLSFCACKQNIGADQHNIRPTLALSKIRIEIKEDLKLTVHGSWFSFAYNLLMTLFAEQIRDYITTTLETTLIDHMMELINPLNSFLEAGSGTAYWPLLLEVTGLDVSTLSEAAPWRGAVVVDIQPGDKDISFSFEGDLGLELEKNMRSRHAVVSSVEKNDDITSSVPIGSRIVAINCLSVAELTVTEVKKVIQNLNRPLTIRFSKDVEKKRLEKSLRLYHVEFGSGPLGLKLRPRPLCPFGAIVTGFLPLPDGSNGPAAKSGKIKPGFVILRLNDQDVASLPFQDVLSQVKAASRPLVIRFAENSDGVIKMSKWPPGVDLDLIKDNLVITRLNDTVGLATLSGKLPKLGDRLHSVKDQSVESMDYNEAMGLISSELDKNEPLSLGFSRSGEFETVVFPPGPLGLKFGRSKRNYIVLKEYVPPPPRTQADRAKLLYPGLMILKICGKNLPSPLDLASVNHLIQSAEPPYSLTVRDVDLYEELLQVA